MNDELQIENDELDFNSKFPTHAINILLNPNDGGSRCAVQLLDGELDKMNTLNGPACAEHADRPACAEHADRPACACPHADRPGVIFAQVFPQMLSSGDALGIKLKAVVLDYDTGLKIQALLKTGAK